MRRFYEAWESIEVNSVDRTTETSGSLSGNSVDETTELQPTDPEAIHVHHRPHQRTLRYVLALADKDWQQACRDRNSTPTTKTTVCIMTRQGFIDFET